MTYALLIYRSVARTGPLPESDERAGLRAHRALQAEAAGRGELHTVARLDDSGRGRTVKRRSGAHEVADGPYIETKEWLVGFYLLDCEDEEAALDRARAICDEHHEIEVRPVT